MMRTLLIALTGLLVSSGANAQGLFETFADYTGGELFQRFCAACHGERAFGDGPVASSLAVMVPDLTRIAQRRGGPFPAAEVRDIIDGRTLVIAHGTRYMPVWGYEFWVEEGADIVAEEETRVIINKLVDYLSSIQRPANP